jgi:rare lipoprotein A
VLGRPSRKHSETLPRLDRLAERHMKHRFRRSLGLLFVFSTFAGCAVQPTTTQTGRNGPVPAVAQGANAPMAFGSAPAQPVAGGKSLADAKPIDDGPDVANFKQVGRASWYGRRFAGRRTASGERFDMNALTAAHKTLPLASYVRVTNLSNQKAVVVKINDRGPYVRGRVLDLSYAAAKLLGLQHSGTARVRIEGLTQEEARAERDEMLASNNDMPKDQGSSTR